MMLLLIQNCHLVTPGVELENASVLVENGRIVRVSAGAIPPCGAKVLDARGSFLMPGFVDVHCHGRNNMDFSDGSIEAVETIAEHKLEEGVTTLLPTTLTLPETDLAATARSVAAYSNRFCRLPGVHLEGPFINPKCIGAQNPAYLRPFDLEEVRRIHAICPVKKITFAVELPGGAEFTSQLLEMGITPSCTHSAAKYQDFAAAYAAGLRNLSHFCNQMTPLHHRDIGLVGAGLLHKDVYAELICDKLHIAPEMIRLVFAVKGCDHVVMISDAMRAAGMPDGDYTLGGLPVVVSGGAARLRDGGALAGSTLQIATALRNVAEVTGLPLSELVKASGWNAARSLGLAGIGKIEPGFLADMVILNDRFEVETTLVGGEVRYRR